MKAQVTLGLAAVVGLTTAATADVLWDQSNYSTDPNALVDQEFGDFPTYSSYMVTDVVADTDWVIQSVSVYFTSNNGNWGQFLSQARLNIFDWVPGTLPLAADDPTAGAVVSVGAVEQGDSTWKITASGLNVNLDAGNYWIGLTPIVNFADGGQEFHRPAPIINDNNAWRNPGGAFGYGTDWIYAHIVDGTGEWENQWEASILIEGVPAPGALALLGLAGLLGRRRR
ncbi:MAG: MYXO-CTERM sorting domain-containing protein [Planctomycetota bacterium]|nr:MYXO-CTERM sorting domain-containing protein [Planctomycetota bacterium]